MVDFPKIKLFTFDCYGTLIDWEKGIILALKPYLEFNKIEVDDDIILELYGKFESEIQKDGYIEYKNVLKQVVQKFNEFFKISEVRIDENCLIRAFNNWEPFEDTVGSLKKLKEKFKLAIISNIDNDMINFTLKKLEVQFDFIITAEDAKCYKPNRRIFEYALNIVGHSKDEIIHVAQSLYHDIKPAKEMKLTTIWVNRRKGKKGTGATPYTDIKPDFEVQDLNSLIRMFF